MKVLFILLLAISSINAQETNVNSELLFLDDDFQKDSIIVGQIVGRDFNFTHHFVEDFTGDNVPDMLVRTNEGTLKLYKFLHGSFYVSGGGKVVGHDFNYLDYFVGDWNQDGRCDLMVRDDKGNLLLFYFLNERFN